MRVTNPRFSPHPLQVHCHALELHMIHFIHVKNIGTDNQKTGIYIASKTTTHSVPVVVSTFQIKLTLFRLSFLTETLPFSYDLVTSTCLSIRDARISCKVSVIRKQILAFFTTVQPPYFAGPGGHKMRTAK